MISPKTPISLYETLIWALFLYSCITMLFSYSEGSIHFMDDKLHLHYQFLLLRQAASAGGRAVHKLLAFSHHVC